MHRIVELALANRILVILAVCLSVVAGSFAMRHLTIDAVPDITNVQVQILTKSPDSGAGGNRAVHHLPRRGRDERPATVVRDPIGVSVRHFLGNCHL